MSCSISIAATGAMHRQEARIKQILIARAGAGSVEGGMIEEPNELGGRALSDCRDALFHLLDSNAIIDCRFADPPLDPARPGAYLKVHVA